MKVVINTCFGGAGLSNEAFEFLLCKKGVEFEKVEENRSFGMNGYAYYTKGHAGEDDHYIWDIDYLENRSDSDLVAVIEEMGEKANGWAANLKIVEIPDDVEWYVEEYDGREWVAEKHRTWE